MSASIVSLCIYFLCFIASFYALSSLRFEQFCNVQKPIKVQMLLLLLAFGLAYIAGQFLLQVTIYNGF